MKALSIRQPWAHLILHGGKDIENRSWPTNVRGRVLIHAGDQLDEDGLAWLQGRGVPLPDEYPRGGIVGEVEIVDCVRDSVSEWFVGPFGFVLRNPKPLPLRKLKGRLYFFNVEEAP